MNKTTKQKLLNLLIIVSSLFGYLEWGGDNNAFLWEIEGEILSKIFTDPVSILHPLTILPMAGQILILISLFQKEAKPILVYIGIVCIGLLLGLMAVIGILDQNFKILLSTIPFLITSTLAIIQLRKSKLQV